MLEKSATDHAIMATHSHDGLIYESLGIEFQEFSRSGFSERLSVETNRAPSYLSGLSGYSRVDNDDGSLIAHQGSSAPESILDKASGDRGVPSLPQRKRRYRFKSWKVGVMAAAAMTTTVLIVNSVLTVWASVKFGLEDGIGTAHEGACGTVGAWSFWLHILINGLSSMLLSASNYTMQCVTAPTRRECDRAHSRGDWLDIGVPSVRNLSRIGWQRRIMWFLLAISSVPIHLLYNAAVFKTLDDNSYSRWVVGRKFLENDYTLEKYFQPSSFPGDWNITNLSILALHNDYMEDRPSYKNLSNDLCIEKYATFYLSGYADVILIADDTYIDVVPTKPSRWGNSPFSWICNTPVNTLNTCNSVAAAKGLIAEGDWTLGNMKIDYCMAKIQAEHCKLQFSVYILIAVILCNAAKCTTMFWVLWQQRETTFITFGDAIASWLDKPDLATVDCCFVNVRNIAQKPTVLHAWTPQPIDLTTRRWRLGVSKRRWTAAISLLTVAVLASGACLGMTVAQMTLETADTMTSLGFGVVNTNMLLDANLPESGARGLVSSVLFANLPQIILSFVFLSYNALITCMLLANEYSGYGVHRKPLRVTTPHGKQRKTYWLQIPFTYGVPMVAVSATLHWLISQSVFLVRVDTYKNGTVLAKSSNISAIGLSPLSMVVILILGTCITAIAVGMGYWKLEGLAMPVAASCSFALAAAAHRPAADVDAAVLPVKWGEVVATGNSEFGHCCFTSQEVLGVMPGRKYA